MIDTVSSIFTTTTFEFFYLIHTLLTTTSLFLLVSILGGLMALFAFDFAYYVYLEKIQWRLKGKPAPSSSSSRHLYIK